MDSESTKIKLFGSDEEEEDNYEDFRIRPQFQGPHGQQMLELSSRLPERFKLDERFAEVFEPEYQQDAEDNSTKEKNEEREKNIRILESVLGHEVCPKSVNKNKAVKRQIRFDPDDENASHLVKNPETPPEKSKKSKKKKKVEEEKVEQTIPISTERYIEVCPDLKEILNTATPFSFSQQFHHKDEVVEDSGNAYDFHEEKSSEQVEEKEAYHFKERGENKSHMHQEKLSPKLSKPKSRCDAFFVTEGDPRLKEGIEFFKRPKPLEEIRIEWQKRREHVLELFRRKKKSSQRSYRTRVQSIQNKFAIRKQNFKNKFK